MEKIEFGSSGHMSTRLIFGAAAFWDCDQATVDKTMDLVLGSGINHIDTAADYNRSETLLGDWISRNGRPPCFIATKTGKRTKREALEEIQRSLERLRLDSVDLIQLHNLVDPQEWERAFGEGGALEAAVEAKRQGLARHIGVTGHGIETPAVHLRALARFPFESVLFPYNYLMMRKPGYASAVKTLLDECRKKRVAVQTIKAIAAGDWGDLPKTRNTWYRPLESAGDIALAIAWSLGEPGLFVNSAAEPDLLPQIIVAAETQRKRPPDSEMEAMRIRLGMSALF